MKKATSRNRVLWTAQAVLAVMFLLAGVPKLVMSAEQMTAPGPIQLPVAFIRFIGVCEILGAIGMVVPGLTGIRPGLTPLGAAGLVIIMIGATVVNLVDGPRVAAIITVVLGSLAAFVVYGRGIRPVETTPAGNART